MTERFLSPNSVSFRLGIAVTTCREWMRKGILPAVKLPSNEWRMTESGSDDQVREILMAVLHLRADAGVEASEGKQENTTRRRGSGERMTRPTDEEMDMLIEELALFRDGGCKTQRCVLIHQRMIDVLEWVLGRRDHP
jgi:hypothetical protein